MRDHLASQIETAELRPNAKLRSERTLSEAFGIMRMTARQALLQLESEGLIHRLDRSAHGGCRNRPDLAASPSP